MQRKRNRKTYLHFLNREIANQRKWIEDHGGSMAAYIMRYGDPDLHYCYGNGGTAIYKADVKALESLERELAEIVGLR